MSQGPHNNRGNPEGLDGLPKPSQNGGPYATADRVETLRALLLSGESSDRIIAMNYMAQHGVDCSALLDGVISCMRGLTATTSELQAAACVLLSTQHAQALLGLRIEGIAQYLTLVTSAAPSETTREAIAFLRAQKVAALLLSPTVFALPGLNPHLRDMHTELGRFAAPLLAHIRSVREKCAEQGQIELGQTWDKWARRTAEIFRGFNSPALEARAELLEQVERIRAVRPDSVEALAARYTLAVLCREAGGLLLSQSLGSRVAGTLRHSVGTAVDWLSYRVGAASADQLIRIAFQPIPIRELRLGFHGDTGTFGVGPLLGAGLDDEIRRASFIVAMNDFHVPEGSGEGLDSSQHHQLLGEFASRYEEVISRAPFQAVCTELKGLMRSHGVSNVESLCVPDFLLPQLDPRDLLMLKHLELFHATERTGLGLYDPGVLQQVESLTMAKGARLSMIRKGNSLTRLRRIDLCDADECFNLRGLSENYCLQQLQSVTLRAPPSNSSLRYLLVTTGASTTRFVWSDELNSAGLSGESRVSQLEVSEINIEGIRELARLRLPQLRQLSLRKLGGGVQSVLPILDRLSEGQLEVFEITTQDGSITKLDDVLNHPALRNVCYLTLGIPGTIGVLRRLSQIECRMTKLHSIGFENDAAASMETGDIASVEQDAVTRWLTHALCEIRYPWPISNSSLLDAACDQPHAEVRFGSTTYSVVRDEGRRDSSSVGFILKRHD